MPKIGRKVLGVSRAIPQDSAEMTRLVLFDIDGTLIRTGGAGVRAFARTADVIHARPGGTDSLRFHGRTDTSLVREFLRTHRIPDTPWNVRHFLDAYVFLLDAELRRGSGELCPGVREYILALRALPEPPLLGLLTGNVRLGAALKLAAHGLADEFVLGAFGDDHEDRNQLAVIARDRANRRLGRRLEGHEIVVVGDTAADIECAHYIGARCLAVSTGGVALSDLLAHSPAVAVESLEEPVAGTVVGARHLVGTPTDWELLYRTGDTRWDKGQPAPGLVEFLMRNPPLPRGRVLVPGCGRGHDAVAWARAGHQVQGLDLAPSAVAEAALRAPSDLPAGSLEFVAGDFLQARPSEPSFDVIFEHTLFWAIPPAHRDEYLEAIWRHLRPGGSFLGLHFLQPREPSGPPFGVTVAEVLQRFGNRLELVGHWVPSSFEGRRQRERFFHWRRPAGVIGKSGS